MTRLILAACIAIPLGLALLACWFRLFAQRERCPATRWIEDDDGIQPADPWPYEWARITAWMAKAEREDDDGIQLTDWHCSGTSRDWYIQRWGTVQGDMDAGPYWGLS